MGEKGHVMVLPFPAQGHITPIIQLSKRFISKGLTVTLLSAFIKPHWVQPPMPLLDISADAPQVDRDPSNIIEFMNHMRQVVSAKLPQVVDNHKQRNPVTCLVYDSIIPWALHIANDLGLKAVPLFTQPCAVNALLYASHQGLLKIPVDRPLSIPGLPPLDVSDLPSFIHDSVSFPPMLGLLTDQFSNLEQAHCVLCNSFDALEPNVTSWLSAQWPLKNIGPTVPSIYLDKRLEEDTDYGVRLFKPEADTCRKWLDSKADASVVYVAFGSVASMSDDQIKEIARGLRNSKSNFLWVVRDAEVNKLPRNFVEETKERGVVVSWCQQLEVLSHRAVGCFVSHCGWNSMLEAMCLGVPMVGLPQWSDQPTNAKFMSDVWRFGLRAKPDQRGTVTSLEIEDCIAEVMENVEIRTNSHKWQELAKAAIDESGSSDRNIQEFVDSLSIDESGSSDRNIQEFVDSLSITSCNN